MTAKPVSSLEDTIARLRKAGFDTEDFLSSLDEKSASWVNAPAEMIEITPPVTLLSVDAATRGRFLPSDLTSDVETHKSSIAEIVAVSDVLSTGSDRVWQLRPKARRDILIQARNSNLLSQFSRATDALKPYDLEGPLLRRVLAGERLDLDLLEFEDLEHLAIVAEWLEGSGLADLPHPLDLRRLIAQREILDPFRLLVGRQVKAGPEGSEDRVVGRSAQTEQLRAYVGLREPEELKHYVTRVRDSLWSAITLGMDVNQPLLVRGIGGMGKSTLIGKFVLDHALFTGVNLPFAYLDFDRAGLAPRQPLQLLLEIARQLGLCLPLAEPSLSSYQTFLRNTIDNQAKNFNRRQRESVTHSELFNYCESLRSIVEEVNGGNAPVLIVFDTYEIVQYDEEAVAGVNALIKALRTPEKGEWNNLRLVIAGRGDLADIETTQKPIDLGQLTFKETSDLLRRRSKTEALNLAEAHIAAIAPALRNSPLDVIVVTNWLKSKEPEERVPLLAGLIKGIDREIDATAQSEDENGAELVALQITGILTRRMIEHINDKDVRKLAEPGLVVRTITPEIIREVMVPVSGLDDKHPLAKGAEYELFRRLEKERWLVTRQGSVLRHRPEVRRAMLALMRSKDRQRFDNANELALEKFRARADQDETARAEAIYHMLLGARVSLDEVDALWTPSMARPLASAVDDLSEHAQNYLKAKLGRSVPVATLATFSFSILTSLLAASGTRLLRRLGAEAFLKLLDANPNAEELSGSRELFLEAVYRTGRWSRLRNLVSGRTALNKEIEVAVEILKLGSLHDVARLPPSMLRALRFVLRWATRDSEAAKLLTRPIERFLWSGPAARVIMDVPEIAWDFATLVACEEQRNFSGNFHPVMEQASNIARSGVGLPDAAVGSDALRILSFFETAPDRPILKRVDLVNHFATLSRREVEAFLVFVTDQLNERWELRAVTETAVSNDFLGIVERGNKLAKRLLEFKGDFVIADAEITSEVAAVIRGCILSGPPQSAGQALRVLACKHPDWLEPLGNALTRAFDGNVPTRIGWWSTIERYVGSGERARKAKQTTDGRAILSLADEAANLHGAVEAYVKLLDNRKDSEEAREFIALSQAFNDWVVMIDRMQPLRRR